MTPLRLIPLLSLGTLAACGSGGGGGSNPQDMFDDMSAAQAAQFDAADAAGDQVTTAPSGSYQFVGYARMFGNTPTTNMEVVMPATVTGNFSNPSYNLAFGGAVANVNGAYGTVDSGTISINDRSISYDAVADHVVAAGEIDGSVSAMGHSLTFDEIWFEGFVTEGLEYMWAATNGTLGITLDGANVSSGGFELSGQS